MARVDGGANRWLLHRARSAHTGSHGRATSRILARQPRVMWLDWWDSDDTDVGAAGGEAPGEGFPPGPALRRAREARGQGMRQIAAAAGVTHGYLSKVERGHVAPTWATIERIAAAIGFRPRLQLVSTVAEIRRRLEAEAGMTVAERLRSQPLPVVPSLLAMV